jgi:hypothetical protein
VIRLACPNCSSQGGTWTVGSVLETWRGPDGEKVAVAAGTCERCASRVLFDPSGQAVTEIGARQAVARTRLARLHPAAEA